MCGCVCLFVSGSVGVQNVPDGVCACFCDIWSGCHAYRTLCINCADRNIDLEGLNSAMMVGAMLDCSLSEITNIYKIFFQIFLP